MHYTERSSEEKDVLIAALLGALYEYHGADLSDCCAEGRTDCKACQILVDISPHTFCQRCGFKKDHLIGGMCNWCRAT